MPLLPITVWHTVDGKTTKHSHIEEGHCSAYGPTPLTESQASAWGTQLWAKAHGYLDTDAHFPKVVAEKPVPSLETLAAATLLQAVKQHAPDSLEYKAAKKAAMNAVAALMAVQGHQCKAQAACSFLNQHGATNLPCDLVGASWSIRPGDGAFCLAMDDGSELYCAGGNWYWNDELVRKVRAGKAGKYALLLDIYEHTTVTVHLPGEMMGGYAWDTTRSAAAWIPTPELARSIGREVSALVKTGVPRAEAERQVAIDCCRKDLEQFNDWANGRCFGVCVYAVDIETGDVLEEDECWGYVGYEYAGDELTHTMELTSHQYCRQ